MHHQAVAPVLTDGGIRLDAHTEADVAFHLAGEDVETGPPVRLVAGTLDAGNRANRRKYRVKSSSADASCESRPYGVSAHVSCWTHHDRRGRGLAPRMLNLLVEYARTLALARPWNRMWRPTTSHPAP